MRTCPQCGRDFASKERICPDDGSVLKDKVSVEDQAIGRTLDGKYRIDGFLKRGGMGSVFRGTHVLLNKPVAVKLIRPELVTSQDIVERFFREARAAAKLSHPNIVTVHDLGQTDDGTLYIIMEIVDGQSLKDLIVGKGPWAPARALRFCRGVASALSVAHRNGIIHRDLKPQNIMVARDSDGNESPKLLDFGIAKTLEPDSPALTSTGMVLGTPHYMSAEQAKGMPADQRSDIYALGVILYEMLVGKVPFDDKSIPSILVKHLTEAPRPPSSLRGDIPREVETLVLRCLEKDPDRRFQSADELARALVQREETEPHRVLDPTLATMPLNEQATVESKPGLTGAGGASAAAVRPPVPFPPPVPAAESTGKMESGTVRAREVQTPAPRPQPAKPQSSSRTGLFLGLAVIGFLVLVMAGGGFLLYRLVRGNANETNTEVQTASAGALEVPAEPTEEPVNETPPPSETEPPADTPLITEAVSEEPSNEATPPPPQRENPPPPPPTREQPRAQAQAQTPPPRAASSVPVQPAPPAEEPIPENPTVSVDCEGVRDACGEIRTALQQALEKRGMRSGRAAAADIQVLVAAEEVEARTEEQFGNTFVIRTYSVTLDAEAPRFGDSVTFPPRTFSFDARLGRDKLRGEAHVIATSAAERIEKYWETKLQGR
jgi:eukaryotic-like serine/threonine-protein kinase